MDIKVFKNKNSQDIKYQENSNFDKIIWNYWLDMIKNEPEKIVKHTIPNLKIIALIEYVAMMFPGNPHTAKSNDDLWIQVDKDIRALDLSFKEYRVPAGEKVHPSALQLWWRTHNGNKSIKTPFNMYDFADKDDLLKSGKGTNQLELPFSTVKVAKLDNTDWKYEDEINNMLQFIRQNYSLIFDTIVSIIPNKIKWPILKEIKNKLSDYSIVRFYRELYDIKQIDALDIWHTLQLKNKADLTHLEFKFQDQQNQSKFKLDAEKLALQNVIKNITALKLFKEDYGDLPAAKKLKVDEMVKKQKTHKVDKASIDFIQKVHKYIDLNKDISRFRTEISKLNVCSHYVTLIDDYVRTKNIQTSIENVVKQWADKTQINGRYYCSQCGELLMTDLLEDFNINNNKIITGTTDKDPIWLFIISEVTSVVRLVKFAQHLNLKNFVIGLSQTIEQEIINQQTILMESKTISIEDAKTMTLLYISTYTFAYLSHLMINNSNLSWNVRIDKPVEAAKGGEIVIEKIGGNKSLKILSIAYNLLIDINHTKITSLKDFNNDMVKPLLIKAYNWSKNAKFNKVEVEKDTTVLENHDAFIDTWESVKTIYHLGENFDGCNYPENLKKDDRYANGVNAWLQYNNLEIYKEFAVPTSAKIAEFNNKFKNHLNEERLGNVSKILYLNKNPVPSFQELDISQIRCPSGEKHNFSLKSEYFIVDNKQLKLADIISMIKDYKKYSKLKITNELCARCKMAADAKPDKKAAEKIHASISRQNFYKYYEYRCPKGEMHEYKDETCTKCSYKKAYNDEQPLEYYKKYDFIKPQIKVIEYDKITVKKSEKYDKWNHTLTSILAVSKLTKESYNAWINLGLTENVYFAAINQGKVNPQNSQTEEIAKGRILKLTNYTQLVRQVYIMLRNSTKITLSGDLKELVNKSIDVKEDILVDFDQKLEYYLLNQSNILNCNFVLFTLCQTLSNIYLKKNGKYLFEYLVTRIFTSEKMFSLLEIQKTKTKDNEYENDVQVEKEDDLEEEEITDPFSLENTDIETTNMGFDDEEFMD